ncbi:multidrug ABC transporter ATP-binding protein [Actinoplanes philippinensis]|uniref:ABC-2 type transport system ATP-binding protein n=1 Tax=Actinoplanes philippinensis TaxID=35752 RepID=A0A1I2ABH7_9ACTN|nr:ABC transporter ATP-binding protein [Actinoplanes philippinensis]GIE74975.1 multidrug ABC transporter ATP-binding protein [Actinoplanes philippinensis]SFE41222.1 ABC-2 type transport system ATP-binding protein [Actinoplanes philippinensis]
MSTQTIEVDGLRQRYGDFEAVRGIGFSVGAGRLFALLGTNGAGKTTTMEVLEGFRPAASGSVRLLDADPYRDRRALRPRVGIMLQESGLIGDLTVAETVGLWRDLHADPLPADEALKKVDLTDRSGIAVRQLSGGQKRRLDLALAIVGRPEVLFLDEPTTGMDPEARIGTWRLIQELVAGGTTVLLTTHYLEEAERLADRIAIMHRGEIRVAGTVPEVVSGHGDRIAFRVPAHTPIDALPLLDGRPAEIAVTDGLPTARWTVSGGDPDGRAHRAVAALVAWAAERGVTLDRLSVRPASLEDVFLSIVESR